MTRVFERLTHHGHLEDGKLVLDNSRWFKGTLQQFANCPVVVTVERRKNKRSKQQLGYLWGIIYPTISQHTGHTSEDLHDIFKAKFLRRKKVWRGADMVVVGTTTGLSVNEMAEFITNVIVQAQELGIEVPPADPSYQWK